MNRKTNINVNQAASSLGNDFGILAFSIWIDMCELSILIFTLASTYEYIFFYKGWSKYINTEFLPF